MKTLIKEKGNPKTKAQWQEFNTDLGILKYNPATGHWLHPKDGIVNPEWYDENSNNVVSKDFERKFFESSDETGRFMVVSFRTGKKYYVEPIAESHTPGWGDVNPATGDVEGSYGKKYPGGIREKDSLLTKENGFDDVVYAGIGGDPISKIDELDAKYPDKQ